MKHVKLSNPLKFQHFLAAVPKGTPTRFPFDLMGNLLIAPYSEGDSGRITSLAFGRAEPVQLVHYSTEPLFNKSRLRVDQWEQAGWELFPISSADAHTSGDTERLRRLSFYDPTKPMSEKLTASHKYAHLALLRPLRGHRFPVDMLRYDRCYPYTNQDAAEIERTLEAVDLRGLQPVNVLKHWDSTKVNWQLARWRSFGWELVQADFRNPKAAA